LINAVVRRRPTVPSFAFPFRHRFRGLDSRPQPLESARRCEEMVLRRLSPDPGRSTSVAAPGTAAALLDRVVARTPTVPLRTFPNGLFQRRVHNGSQPENAALLSKRVVIGRTVPLILAVLLANAELAVHSLVDVVVACLEFVSPPAPPAGQPFGISGERTKPSQPAYHGEVFVMCGGFSSWHE